MVDAMTTNTAKIEEPATPLDGLAALRAPFPTNQVSKLPKPTKAQTDEVKADYKKGVRCELCGAWHHPKVVHLDYVGHAALTDRLLDVDLLWFWEPLALRDGLPAFDGTGGLWIKLTVCGMTRLGYGNAAAKPGGDPGNREKEIIGDALRNAAMRFGAALDLWHKGDLHADDATDGSAPNSGPSALDMAVNLLRGCGDSSLFKSAWSSNIEGWKKVLSPDDLTALGRVKNEIVAKFVAEAAEAKAREKPATAPSSPPAGTDPFDDEIPF